MTKLWHSFFDEVDVKSWTIYRYHRNWINFYKDCPEQLVYGKAVDILAKSLRSIANSNSDVKKVEKANKLLKASTHIYMRIVVRRNLLDICGSPQQGRGVMLLAGPLTDLLDCYGSLGSDYQRKEGNNIDKLWLTVENKENRNLVLQERNVNTGTNCIQLVSCKDIQISNVGQKRSYENEESVTSTKKTDEEMISSESPTVKKLEGLDGIARYRIVFLPEENDCNPIKSAFDEEEWLKFETDWEKVEETMVVNDGVDRHIENLLKKYDDAIIKATTGYSVNLSEVVGVFNECTLINRNCYIFSKEWPLQWTQSIYNAFLAVNPLHDGELSEYAYRDKIVNPLIENVFLDINEMILENSDRKVQKDSSRSPGARRATGWEHDALLVMKVKSIEFQIGFAMQLGLFRLRRMLREQGVDEKKFNCAETFGILVYKKDYHFYSMHYADGIYLVDKFDEFAIPSSASQLCELSEIIKSLFSFKQRVVNLHHNMQDLFNGKRRFKQKSRHCSKIATKTSPKSP
ncbi:hypothetical protein C1646_775618 [Rhizophagus diaphanus]|nr:hypothetical protein C1646_775618 [Rhizophagus diaphanus] [Rhizophagus sp. MUCL 43196]